MACPSEKMTKFRSLNTCQNTRNGATMYPHQVQNQIRMHSLVAKGTGIPPSLLSWDYTRNHLELSRCSLLDPRVYFPTAILLVQSTLLTVGWIFFGLTISKPIALSDASAEVVGAHEKSVTMISTLLASLLSIITSLWALCHPSLFLPDIRYWMHSFYSHSIRYSLTSFLTVPVSLFVISSSITVAQGAPITNFSRLKWTIAGLVSAIAATIQTAG